MSRGSLVLAWGNLLDDDAGEVLRSRRASLRLLVPRVAAVFGDLLDDDATAGGGGVSLELRFLRCLTLFGVLACDRLLRDLRPLLRPLCARRLCCSGVGSSGTGWRTGRLRRGTTGALALVDDVAAACGEAPLCFGVPPPSLLR